MNRIGMHLWIAWSLLAWGARAALPQSEIYELRKWEDDSGRFRVEAAFVRFEGERVQLRRADGRKFVAPIARLSEPDKSFLRRLALTEETATHSWPLLFTGPGEGLRAEYYCDMSLD